MKIFKILAALALTAGLCFGLFFAVMMVVCTGGGALMIIIPIALVVLSSYIKVMKLLFRGKKADAKPNMDLSAEKKGLRAIIAYIIDARATGLTDKEIFTNLQDAGWPDDEIQIGFNTLEYSIRS